MAKAAKKAKKSAPRRRASKSKDDEVEVSTGVQLLLGNIPDDRDAKANYEILMRLLAASRSASGKVGDQKKKMREIGLDVSAFMNTMKLEKMDPLELAQHLQEQARLSRMRGLPIQMTLHETKYKSSEEQAFALGHADGLAGRTANTKTYPEEHPCHANYMDGWQSGQKDLVKKNAGGGATAKDADAFAEDEE